MFYMTMNCDLGTLKEERKFQALETECLGKYWKLRELK
jgi:hypothetical protein